MGSGIIMARGRDTPRYDFQMEFRIAAPRRGRWIKLSWLGEQGFEQFAAKLIEFGIEYYSIRNRDNKDGISDTDPDDSDRNHFGLEHEGEQLQCFARAPDAQPYQDLSSSPKSSPINRHICTSKYSIQ